MARATAKRMRERKRDRARRAAETPERRAHRLSVMQKWYKKNRLKQLLYKTRYERAHPDKVRAIRRRAMKKIRKKNLAKGFRTDGLPRLTGWQRRKIRIEVLKQTQARFTPKQRSTRARRAALKRLAKWGPEEVKRRMAIMRAKRDRNEFLKKEIRQLLGKDIKQFT